MLSDSPGVTIGGNSRSRETATVTTANEPPQKARSAAGADLARKNAAEACPAAFSEVAYVDLTLQVSLK